MTVPWALRGALIHNVVVPWSCSAVEAAPWWSCVSHELILDCVLALVCVMPAIGLMTACSFFLTYRFAFCRKFWAVIHLVEKWLGKCSREEQRLKSMCCPHAQVGMNLVPLMHRRVSLATRCEQGLSGFLTLDIMRMLAENTCRSMGLPTGSAFLAGQTITNLQASSLSGVILCITKSEEFNPWNWGHARLSELSIEEQFSFYRQQSANSQLTSRAFWRAAARTAMRTGRQLNCEPKAKDFVKGEKPLGKEELL